MENLNKQIKNEMEEILWTPVETKVDIDVNNNTTLEGVDVVDLKKPENEIIIENGEEVTVAQAPKADKPKAPKAPRTRKAPQQKNNADWSENLPEDKKLSVGTVVCFRPGDLNKIGEFTHYARKENVIWVNMFKKNSTEYMTKPWAVKMEECEIVFDGNTLNDKYGKNDNGAYFVK